MLSQHSDLNTEAIAKDISAAMSQDAEDVLNLLGSILRNDESRQTFLDCRGDMAQHLLNLLQDVLDLFPESRDSPLLSRSLLRLSEKSQLHPACFPLADVRADGYAVAGGGFGDIYLGLVRGQTVAVKRMRAFEADADAVKVAVKKFGREAVLWRQLFHPNVLPFLGMYYMRHSLCLVSPWMSNGDIIHFLKNAPPDTDRVPLILDIALGIEYLHSKHIVHGDLTGINILVTPSRRACVADFGLSSIVTTLKFQHTATGRGGTLRYQAPELLRSPEAQNHFGSDIYAFACICYQILSGKPPYFEVKNDLLVAFQVPSGLRPTRTETISNVLWSLLEDCWHEEPTRRPGVTQIIERLRAPPISAKEANSSADWDETFSTKFRGSLQDQLILPSVATIQKMIFGDGSTSVAEQRK
ncbi:kinase-like domain-containing protein [Mycena galopus ATCC 62051]|nr:kinase-like domain-containing protein [Mycena galopus ATCC 62051]